MRTTALALSKLLLLAIHNILDATTACMRLCFKVNFGVVNCSNTLFCLVRHERSTDTLPLYDTITCLLLPDQIIVRLLIDVIPVLAVETLLGTHVHDISEEKGDANDAEPGNNVVSRVHHIPAQSVLQLHSRLT